MPSAHDALPLQGRVAPHMHVVDMGAARWVDCGWTRSEECARPGWCQLSVGDARASLGGYASVGLHIAQMGRECMQPAAEVRRGRVSGV